MERSNLSGTRYVELADAENASRVSSGGTGSEIEIDEHGRAEFINESGFDSHQLMAAMREQHPEIAALVAWQNDMKRPRAGTGGIFERDRYVAPVRLFDQMRAAQHAVEYDDVCGGVLDASEALCFSKMSIECEDEDEEDIWNQIMEDIDLDTRMREMWRELFSVSQFYACTYWGRKTYRVSGRSNATGVKRKKVYTSLRVPLGVTLLDPLSVVPVGSMLFNQDQLAYMSSAIEANTIIEPALAKPDTDPIIANMFVSKYQPTVQERAELAAQGVQTDYLYLLNPATCWRHTDTRPQYKRWAAVRIKSVFDVLDMKQQLKEMDRATLLGSANFLVIVRKGSKEEPAKPGELENLQANMRMMARVPFIFGDHRLQIDILTPDNSNTLKPERYQSVNSQISSRLWQMFVIGAGIGRSDDSIKLARVIARGLESRRGQLQRKIEHKLLDQIFASNEAFESEPSLRFHPRQIALDFDPGLADFLLDLRDRREISRDTLLSQIDLSEVEEARKRTREAEHFDDIFDTLTGLQDPKLAHELQLDTLAHEQLVPKATGVPAAKGTPTATNPSGQRGTPVKKSGTKSDTKNGGGGVTDPKGAGRTRGGNRKGGGAAPGTGQGQAPDPRRRTSGK